jgi:hypothetical protein
VSWRRFISLTKIKSYELSGHEGKRLANRKDTHQKLDEYGARNHSGEEDAVFDVGGTSDGLDAEFATRPHFTPLKQHRVR